MSDKKQQWPVVRLARLEGDARPDGDSRGPFLPRKSWRPPVGSETETYLSASFLTSDEVVEAAAEAAQGVGDTPEWEKLPAAVRGVEEARAEAALQAALATIEGGTDAS